MSHIAFAALLIMPLSLAPLQAHAQMVPASDADATQSFLSESSTKLYSTPDPAPSDIAAPISPADPALTPPASPADPAPTPHAPEPILPPAASSPSTLINALPATLLSATPDPVSSSLSPGAPVTLPPKPTKIHDLPSPGQGDHPRVRPFQAVAFGLTASSLGAGGELAIPMASTFNLRVGASYLLWHYPFNIDGIDYNPGLKFTSARATIDWFPHHGAFHVSAGALYFRNTIGGSADVVEGQTFSLGGTNYINSVDDPIHGTANLAYGKQIAPLALLGFGNILPRSGRHLSMPFEFGGAYMKPPTINLKLIGTACTNQGCFDAATDPQVQANVVKEVTTLQSDIRFLQVYPIVSLGLACRF